VNNNIIMKPHSVITISLVSLLIPLIGKSSNIVTGFVFVLTTRSRQQPQQYNNNHHQNPYIQSQSTNMKQNSKLNLFWKNNNDKKEKEEATKTSQSNVRQTSKMGTTAMTMENFKQSQDLGKKTGQLMQELSSMQVEGVAAKGKIKVFVDGQQQPVGIEIDDDYFNQEGVENFSEELLLAMQDAHKKSMLVQQDKMQSLYSELGLPTSK